MYATLLVSFCLCIACYTQSVMCKGMDVADATLTWNVLEKYGSISHKSIQEGINDARDVFESTPSNSSNTTIILQLNSGTYEVYGAINFTNKGIHPGMNGGSGKFVIRGQDTILIFTDLYERIIYGWNVYNVIFAGIHFTRANYTVSQGTIHNVNMSLNSVDLWIHKGFPDPNLLISPTKPKGLFLRRYTNNKTDPHLIGMQNIYSTHVVLI